MNRLKEISLFILIGIITTSIACAIKSSLIFRYLQENIIGLLITLLAINTATSGLIASKIQDITIQYKELDFTTTIKEMKKSLFEQILLIVIAFACLLIIDSSVIIFNYKSELMNAILVSVFAFAINNLWDTGKAVFIIIDEINKINKN